MQFILELFEADDRLLTYFLLWIISTVISTSSASFLTYSIHFVVAFNPKILPNMFFGFLPFLLYVRRFHPSFPHCVRDFFGIHVKVFLFLFFHVLSAVFYSKNFPQEFLLLFSRSWSSFAIQPQKLKPMLSLRFRYRIVLFDLPITPVYCIRLR